MEKRTEAEFRELLAAAFADAKAKGKVDWKIMHVSVLKNRLLQRTNKQFTETSYGARTMQDLIARFPDILALQEGPQPTVTFLAAPPNETPVDDQDELDRDSFGIDESLDDATGFQVILDQHRMKGDNLGMGEAYASQLPSVDEADLENTFVKIVLRWGSPSPMDVDVNDLSGLVTNVDKFVNDLLARAVVHATLRIEDANRLLPSKVGDLYYRVAASLRSLFDIPGKERHTEVIDTAIAKTRELRTALELAVKSFCQSTVFAAKLPSTNVIRHAHAYENYALWGERQILQDVEALLGPLFRRFCESCERHDAESIPRQSRDLRRQLQRPLDSSDGESWLRANVLMPIAVHMSSLIEEGTQTSESMVSPAIEIVGRVFKLDFDAHADELVFPVRVVNAGDGFAYGVRVKPDITTRSVVLSMSDPPKPFDLPPHTERLIRIALSHVQAYEPGDLDVTFQCETMNEKSVSFVQRLTFEQQRWQPNWDHLIRNPPYAINPIRAKENLYGRDSVLEELEHRVSNSTSTFLWGQKRVGKTSVLHVLAASLRDRADVTCVILRMGELTSLHEGQLAHTIARRLVQALNVVHDVPPEGDFRGGLNPLVPIVEELAEKAGKRLLIIIDEFDDLNSAFYLGERGKQFVKALRTLSEVGLTFMFVGSERMDSIYRKHATDLNKWVDLSLDRIEESDCAALITEPVAGMIEYENDAIAAMVDYCRGNPFYMHLIADRIFRRCVQERRTFVGSSDFEHVRRSVIGELGPTNFAHFWEDEPILDPSEKLKTVANNCLLLACIATLGLGRYESLDDIVSAQKQLRVESQEQLPVPALQRVENGLVRRRILSKTSKTSSLNGSHAVGVELPIFRDWLLTKGEAELLQVWRSCRDELQANVPVEGARVLAYTEPTFPIHEDDLVPVSSRLTYLGTQKDVAEVRRWLRQFDDDSRIEVAFLLLKRLAERGFFDHGAATSAIEKMDSTLMARRLELGQGVWKVQRRRRDNLYLGHVDSDTKSGAAMTRELAKRMSPGKASGVEGIPTWLKAHWNDDPMVAIVDDFAGTGRTLRRGLKQLWADDEDLLSEAASQGRVVCTLQAAFPEVVDLIRQEYPTVPIFVMNMLGDDVRAFSSEANIFEDKDREFAESAMRQIGRELVKENPLGFGDLAALVSFHNTIPNNTLPVFWSTGRANGRDWEPLLPRGTFSS